MKYITRSKMILFSLSVIVLGFSSSLMVSAQQTREVRVVGSNVAAGQAATLPVELVSMGNESSVKFSVSFDPEIFTSPAVTLGTGASGATLNVDMSQASAGRLGISVINPVGQSFTTGTQQLVVISANVPVSAPLGSTPIAFGDQPVTQAVLDAGGAALMAVFTPGTIGITQPSPAREVRVVGSSIAAGQAANIPIDLVSTGNESSVKFSASFDPAIFTSPAVTLGTGASGATLNVDMSQAGTGKLGISVINPAGQSFTAGTQRLVIITANVPASAATGGTSITFGDQPIAREVLDAGGASLMTVYTPGTV